MTIIPVGFRTGSTINGTYKADNLIFGRTNFRDFSSPISGTTFWSSPDLDNQWVIYKALSGGTQPTQISGVTANVGFWGTKNAVNPLNHQTFINLLNNTVRKDNPNKFNTPLSAVTFFETVQSDYDSNFFLYNGSVHLDGSSNLTADLVGGAPGTGIFTYECWVLVDDLNSTQGVFSTRSGDTTDGFDLDINTSGNLVVSWSGTTLMTTSNSITTKSWNHLGVVRSGTTWYTLINGVTGATNTSGQNFTSTNLSIGSSALGNNKLRGKISNFKYNQDLALALGAQPKTRFNTITTGTTFCCNFFKSDMYLVDESINNYTLTPVGSPSNDFYHPFYTVKSGLTVHLDADVDISYSGSGSNWYDLSGNGNHGTLSGNTTFDTDKIDFDGTNSFVFFNTITGFTTGDTEYTLSIWVQLDELKTQGLIGYGNTSNTKEGNSLKLTTTGLTTDWTNYGYSESYTFETGSTWYHIATTYDGISRKLYVNGDSIVCPGPLASGLTINDISNLKIGVTNNNEWLNGKVSQVLMYNRCLSEGEVYYNYQITKQRYI